MDSIEKFGPKDATKLLEQWHVELHKKFEAKWPDTFTA